MEPKTEKLAKRSKLFTFIIIFFIISIGRWFNLVIINKAPTNFGTLWSVLYGIIIATIFFYVVDLILARGLLQVKITILKVLLGYITLIIIINQFVIKNNVTKSTVHFILEAFISLILISVLFLVDYFYKCKKDFLFNNDNILPAKYQNIHVLKAFLESFFRLFPYPEPIGLYKIGNPGTASSVIITGNYDLTIRRVVKGLKNIDCWLLVCDSRGVNIWCSTLANHFNTEKIILTITLVHLQEKVDHKNIILPQLCAANVSLQKIKEQTGFIGQFGPVRINDLNEYLTNPRNRQIRKISFITKERVDMAFGTPLFPAIFIVFIFNFINLNKLFVILPAIYGLSFINALIYPYRLIKNIRIWSLFFGLIVFGMNFFIFTIILNLPILIYNITISLAVAYLINEFEGWSPLVKFAVFSSNKAAEITLHEDICIGCERCVEVCPKDVYDVIHKKSHVVNLEECISCKSCFAQCPVGAIEHSAKIINEALR